MKKRGKKKVGKKKKQLKGETSGEWSACDFVNSVWKTMEEQADKSPTIRTLHEKLSPEWNRVSEKIIQTLGEENKEKIAEYVEDICHYGERAVRPLVTALLNLKEQLKNNRK